MIYGLMTNSYVWLPAPQLATGARVKPGSVRVLAKPSVYANVQVRPPTPEVAQTEPEDDDTCGSTE
jgi:hypothetical protein